MASSIELQIIAVDWNSVSQRLHDQGYVIIRRLLSHEQCDALIQQYDQPELYRKTITMERYRFGAGEYKYFGYPCRQFFKPFVPTYIPGSCQ